MHFVNQKTGKALHVLLVDDDEISVLLCAELLKRKGVKTSFAFHGVEALEVFTEKHKSFDVVLMDILLPGIQGYDLIMEFKRIAPSIPVVAITAANSPELRLKCSKLPFEKLLDKPINCNLFVNELLSSLDYARGGM